MIAHLMDTLLRTPEDAGAAMPALLRLVRERDGSIDALVADLERRANGGHAPEVWLVLGDVYREADRLDDAIRAYTRAESIAPASPAPPHALGELYRRMDRRTEARESLDRALGRTTDPHGQGEILRSLMALAVTLRDLASARGYHGRLVALDHGVGVRRELADALLAAQQFSDAVTEYQSVARALAGDNRVLPPVLRDLGRAQLGAGQASEALATLQRALSLAGGDSGVRRDIYDAMAEAHEQLHDLEPWVATLEREGNGTFERSMLLARLHDQLGQTEAGITALRRAIGQRPGDLNAHLQLVEALTRAGRIEDLIAARRQVVALAPGNPGYVTALAELLVQNGRRAEALRMLAQASAHAGSDADAHSELAAVYARLGEDAQATREHELAARLDPDNPDTLGTLAERYLETGQRDRALATARRIMESSRDRARGATRLAEWYANHDMQPQAAEMYREALRLRPDSLDDHKGLAVLLEQSRAYEPAITEWRRVIELAGTDRELRREARSRIVNLWNLAGRLQGQLAALEHLFGATPPDLEAGRDLAEAYARLRRPEDSARVLRRIADLAPGDVGTLTALERLLAQRGELEPALAVLRRLVQADPGHARDWYQRLSQHALALHRDDEAIEYAAHAVQLNPDDAQGHLSLAELYRTRNDTGHAIASFRRALELNDRLFPTYFELADIYLGRDEPREAVQLYRRVLRLAPDDELVARAGRMAIQIAPAGAAVTELERDLAAASAAAPGRAVLHRLLVDLYAAMCRPLIHEVRHGTPAEAAQARTELTRLGSRALAPLLDALSSADAGQQRVALEILGYLGNPNAAGALLTVSEGNGDLDVRREALRAAAALGDPRSLPRLTALARSSDGTLATLATWGVARVRSPAAVTVLTRWLDADQASDVRVMAALGLAGTRDPRARQRLTAALDPAGDEAVQAAAVWALGGNGDLATGARLRAALSGSALVRAAAVAALAAGPREQAPVGEISAALFSPVSPSLRRSAARALVRLAGGDRGDSARVFTDPALAHSGRGMLLALLDPPDGTPDGGDALVRFAPEITRAARDALGLREGLFTVLDALAQPGRLAPLVTTVDSREEVTSAASRITRDLSPDFAAVVGYPDPGVRRRVLRVLSASGTPVAGAALVLAVGDTDPGVSEAAVRALDAFTGPTPPGAAEALARRLGTEIPWTTRLAAAEALGRTGSAGATGALTAALASDPYAYVRTAAARALGALAARGTDPTAVAAAVAALARAEASDADAGVRAAAREARAGIRGPAGGRAAGP